MKHTLPALPYAYDALEPYIDEATMTIHHTKHHQAYVDKLNVVVEKNQSLQNRTLEDLMENIDKLDLSEADKKVKGRRSTDRKKHRPAGKEL